MTNQASSAGVGALFLLTFVVIAVWSWVALTLAELGLFGRSTIMALGTVGSAVAVWAAWRHRGPERREGRISSLVWVAGWIAAAVLLFGQPGEYVIDGSDGSVYLNIGAAVAEHGDFRFSEPVLDVLDESLWSSVFKLQPRSPRVYDFFPGGVQVPPDENRIQPSFFHLYPVWIAIADTVAGLRAGYRVTWVFGLLSVFAIWMLGRELSTMTAANVAAGLLCLNYAQVWVVHIPASEVLAQYFILSGLTFIISAARTSSRLTAMCAGLAFGLAACTRLDMLILVSPLVVGCFGLVAFSRRWSAMWTTMAITFSVLMAQAALHGLLVATPYTFRVLYWMLDPSEVSYLALVVPPVAFAAAVWLWLVRSGHLPPAPRWLGFGVGIAFLLLAGVRLGPEFAVGYLSMVLTPLGGVLAVGGACWLLRNDASPERLLVVAIPLAAALIYAESIRDFQGLPQLLRRFVPAILPLTLVFIGYLVAQTAAVAGRWRVAVLIVPVVVGAMFARDSRPLRERTPMQGLHDQLADVARTLPVDVVLITDSSTPSHFGLSLHYLFGHDVLFVDPGVGAQAAVRAFTLAAQDRGRPVMLAAGRGSVPTPTLDAWVLAGLSLTPAGSVTLQSAQLETTSRHLPTNIVDVASTIDLYDVTPATPAVLPVEIEIGSHDVGGRASGFYSYELMGSTAARWTTGMATVVLPQIAGDAATLTLVLRLAAPRPEGVAAPHVDLELDDTPLAVTPVIEPGFGIVEISLPVWARERLRNGPARLTLRVPTFTPSEAGESADTRALGAAVDWLRLEGR